LLGKLPVKICDTGPLPQQGGALGQNGPSYTIPGVLFLQTFNCRTNGVNFVASADAFVASLLLTLHGNTIKAVVLSSNATAKCHNGTPTAFGNSSILELTVNGKKIVVGTQPNVTVPLIGGYLVINEQKKSVNQFSAIIDVTALHAVITGLVVPIADIAISHTHADIDCP
jgi:hypothetical protein